MKFRYIIIIIILLCSAFVLYYSSTYDPTVTPNYCEVTGELSSIKDELLPISCPNGKIFDAKSIGYTNLNGEIVLLDDAWINASIFYDNYFAIVTNEDQKDAIINKKGVYILDYDYQDIAYLGEDRYFLKKEYDGIIHEYFGLYEEGKINIREVSYEHMYDFHEGLAAVISKENDKIGYIDVFGNIVIPFVYDRNPFIEHRFYEGEAVALKNGYYGIIDRNNQVIVPFEYDYIEPGFENGIYIKFCKDGNWGLMNHHYDIVLEPYYDAIGNISENKVSVSMNQINYAFLDLSENSFITDFIYKKPSHDSFIDYYNFYQNHYAVVTKDSIHYNLLDETGNERFMEAYLGIKMVNKDYILIKYDDDVFYLYQLDTDEILELSGHDILVYTDFNVLAICNEYYEDGAMIYQLFDLNGNEIIPGLKVYDYMFVEEINGTKYLYFNGELDRKLISSYFDTDMNLIWQPKKTSN